MGHHDRDTFEKRWKTTTENNKQDLRSGNPPAVQIISPQKKLYDIQQVINSLPDKHMTTYELQEAIQNILDGE
jgi:hypothetical protein